MSTYPELVSAEELKIFFLNSGKTYKIVQDDTIIGLAYYNMYNTEHVFFKFRIRTQYIDDLSIFLLKDFIGLIISDVKGIKKLQTIAYEFDKKEIEFLHKAGICCEITNKYTTFKYGKLWSTLEYSLVQEELTEFTKKYKH